MRQFHLAVCNWFLALVLFCFLYPVAVLGVEPDAGEKLDQAVYLFQETDYEAARTLLREIEVGLLNTADRDLHKKYYELSETAVIQLKTARQELAQAMLAVSDEDFDSARSLLGSVLNSEYAPADLKIRARARLAKVRILERKHVATVRSSKVGSPSSGASQQAPATGQATQVKDPVSWARDFVEKGMEAIDRGEYQLAQYYFNMAIQLVPDAPRQEMCVEATPGANLSLIPVTKVQHRNVLARSNRRVTMNLQGGIGRLANMQTFPFTTGPMSGVGASGFVQLPNMHRSQIKTTASVGVNSVSLGGGRSFTIVKDYITLVKPQI